MAAQKNKSSIYIVGACAVVAIGFIVWYLVASISNQEPTNKNIKMVVVSETGEASVINLSIPSLKVENDSTLLAAYQKAKRDSINNSKIGGINFTDGTTQRAKKPKALVVENSPNSRLRGNKISEPKIITKPQNTVSNVNSWNRVSNRTVQQSKKAIEPEVKTPQAKAPEVKKKLTLQEKIIASRKGGQARIDIDKDIANTSVGAVVNGNQVIRENDQVVVRLTDDLKYNNFTLLKNTYLYGVCSFNDQGRVNISFSSVNINGKRQGINLRAYDYLDGSEGLIINDADVIALLDKEGSQQAGNEIRRSGTVGVILGEILREKKKEVKVTLYDEHDIILRIKK